MALDYRFFDMRALMGQYKPKSHCCFTGCTPRGCPGGCCVNGFGHEDYCPENTGNKIREIHQRIDFRQRARVHEI